MSGEASVNGEKLRLTVAEARRDDVGRGIVRLDPETLRQIGAAPGDVLEIEGRGKTVAKAMPTFKEQRGQQIIQLDGVGRTNAGVALGQKAVITKVAHAVAHRVVVAPLGAGALHEDEMDHMARRLDGLALKTGDRIRIALFGGSHRDFNVIRTEPDGPVIIYPDTLLAVENPRGSSSGKTEAVAEDIVTYDDLGGMEHEVAKIREMIELPLTHPEIFERLGMTPPKGVLLQGSPVVARRCWPKRSRTRPMRHSSTSAGRRSSKNFTAKAKLSCARFSMMLEARAVHHLLRRNRFACPETRTR